MRPPSPVHSARMPSPPRKKIPHAPTDSRDSTTTTNTEIKMRSQNLGGLHNLIMSPIITPQNGSEPESQTLDPTTTTTTTTTAAAEEPAKEANEPTFPPLFEGKTRRFLQSMLGGLSLLTGEHDNDQQGSNNPDADADESPKPRLPPLVWSALVSFLTVQYLCACVPIGLFMLGMFVSCCVAMIAFACVGLFFLVPVLCFTGMFATAVWAFGWMCFLAGRYALKLMEEQRGGESLDEDDEGESTLGDIGSMRENRYCTSAGGMLQGQDQSVVW